jgi:REP element-mobilizing transposase RayT
MDIMGSALLHAPSRACKHALPGSGRYTDPGAGSLLVRDKGLGKGVRQGRIWAYVRDQRSWARGFFSTTSGNVTDAVILQYLELHSKREPTGVSR